MTENTPPAWYLAQQAAREEALQEKRKRNKLYLIVAAVLALGLLLGLSAASLIPDSKKDVLSDKEASDSLNTAGKEKWLTQPICAANSIGPANDTAKEVRSAQRGMITVQTGDDGQLYETDDAGRCRAVTERVAALKKPPTKPEIVTVPFTVDDASSTDDLDENMYMPVEAPAPRRTVAPKPEPQSDDPFYEPPTYESQKAKVKAEVEDPFEGE